MPMLADRVQVAIKQEAVAGTAEALAAANVVLTTDLPTFETDIEVTERMALSGSLSGRGHVPGARMARIGFKMHLRGTTGAPTDPGNLPDHTVPMRACGALATVSGAGPNEQTAFTPSSTTISDETTGAYCSAAVYRDGKQYLIHGAVGNCILHFRRGAPVMAEYTLTGVFNKPTDVGLLSPTYPTVVEPAFAGASMSFLGFTTAKFDELTLDFGNEIVMRPYPNNASGFFTAQIVRRKPKGSFTPEEELAATKDWWNEFLTGATGAINTGTFPAGGTNYNQFSLSIPKAQYARVGHDNRDGITTSPIEFACLADSDGGNNEWSFVQT